MTDPLKTIPVSLAIIAKDEDLQLINIVKEYSQYFETIHIAYDGFKTQLEDRLNMEVDIETYCKVKIHPYNWCNDFAHKRNWLDEKIDTPYYVRMDTDDKLVGLDNLQYMLSRMEETGTDIVLCNYRYYNDESGNTELAHNRETIIKNDDKLYWKGRIHETVICDDASNVAVYTDKDGMLETIHEVDSQHRQNSIVRNLVILEEEYAKNGVDTDPRIVAYLGRSYADLDRNEEAVPYLELHIDKSGWDEDRYISYLYLAKCHMKLNNYIDSEAAVMSAIHERPDYPAAYAQMCQYYFDREQYDKAIQYGEMCMIKDEPKTNMGYDPSLTTWKVPLFLALSYLHENNTERAVELFVKAKSVAPNSPDVIKATPIFMQAAAHHDYLSHFVKVLKFTRERNGDCVSLVKSMPPELSGHEMVEDLKHKYLPAKTWGDKSVVIFCGNTAHMWSPLDMETGIGGSEEACIHLSRELVKLGHEVTVYSNIPQRRYNDNGVEYRPYLEFNRFDEYNILIGWRQNMAAHDIVAKQHIYWVHDLPNESMLREDKIGELDTVVVLSEYHKSLLPSHVADHCDIKVSTNGINPSDFEVDVCDSIPKRIIYASSYDRGLEIIIDGWSKIKKAEPEAELHIYYGWNTYDKYITIGLADQEWKDTMIKKMQQPGIYEHGRIGHKELIEEYCKASVFAYPCVYSGEINCIALTKAMATNCNIITNNFAVLKERSPMQASNDYFIDAVINELKQPPREGINREYINTMSWESVATDWSERIFK